MTRMRLEALPLFFLLSCVSCANRDVNDSSVVVENDARWDRERTPAAASKVASIRWAAMPAGKFTFWCEPEEPGCRGEIGSEEAVKAFDVMVFEVTVRQYRDCVLSSACDLPSFGKRTGCFWGEADKMDFPVNCVNWNQANQFCSWLGARLPDQVEWEYAAQGGRSAFHPWGNDFPTDDRISLKEGDFRPVGSFPKGATPQGVFDMAGNVMEWTSSFMEQGLSIGYVLKGGYASGSSSGPSAEYLTHSYVNFTPEISVSSIGFRCVKDKKESAVKER